MSFKLKLTSKVFSLRDQRWIHDLQGNQLFDASRTGIFKREFQLRDASGTLCTTLIPQPWKPDPTWLVSGKLGNFSIKRRKKSFERYYWVEDGTFDGVVMEGGYQDRVFRIRNDEHIIAQAEETAFSTKSEIVIDILDDSESTRLLTSIASIIISKEKQESRTGSGSH